jgi:hypothetical protein
VSGRRTSCARSVGDGGSPSKFGETGHSLPLAAEANLRPVCASTLIVQLWRSSSVWTRS